MADADIDVAHVLMGVAMAGMLASGLRTLPDGVWAAVFALVTAWFGGRVASETRGSSGLAARLAGHHVPHLIHGAVMIYMFTAAGTAACRAGSDAGMAGTGGGTGRLSVPALGLAFVLIMAAWAVWDLDRITESRRDRARPVSVLSTEPPAGYLHDDAGFGRTSTGLLLNPRVATAGRVAMGITMALMLIILI